MEPDINQMRTFSTGAEQQVLAVLGSDYFLKSALPVGPLPAISSPWGENQRKRAVGGLAQYAGQASWQLVRNSYI
jgi:hypothetical protein